MRAQPTPEEISVMTRREMKRLCRKFKLSSKGKNWVLRKRLIQYLEKHEPPKVEIIPETRSPLQDLSPVDRALVEYNKGNWERALELYGQCLATWPESDELWVCIGNAHHQLGHLEDSMKAYERALELNEKGILSRRNIINQLLATKMLEKAYQYFDEISKLGRDDEWVWLRMAYICIAKGDIEEALDHLQKILEVDDNLEEVWNLKGVLLMEKDSEAALRCFNRAIEIREDYAIALCNKASALTRLGMVDEAKDFYDRALNLEKRSEFWNNKGVLHMGLDEKLEALACFGKAIEIDPSNAEAWNNRGTLLKEMNRPGEALESFRKALDLCPEFEDARTSLEDLTRKLQTPDDEENLHIEDFLISIPGIGKKKAKVLIESGFNSVQALRKASVNSLASVKGIGENLASTIKEFID